MKKNYYEILEVDKNASPEIIEKAYKTLVKKYHPDLQENNNKQKYEELVKSLNEAYEILSNQEKRNQYDSELEKENIKNQKINNINNNYNKNLNTVKNDTNSININNSYNSINSQKATYEKHIHNAINKAYYDAYVQTLRNMGYKIKYKKSLKDYLLIFFAFIVTFIILFIIFQIPFVKNYFLDLYEQNSAFKLIIDILKNIINIFINILKRDS